MSRKLRVIVKVLTALVVFVVLVVGVGFAYSRGYCMSFTLEGEEISRDEFLAIGDRAMAGEVGLNCAIRQNGIFGLQTGNDCFMSREDLEAFMASQRSS